MDKLDVTRQVIFSLLYISIDLIGLLYQKHHLFSQQVLQESDRSILQEMQINGLLKNYNYSMHHYSEIILNFIVRIIQVMFLFVCFFQFKKHYKTTEYLKNTKSYQTMKNFNALNSLQFKNLPDGQGCATCCICLGNFETNSQIVALKCHNTHIFHKKCMNLHIQNCLEEAKSQMNVWNQINL